MRILGLRMKGIINFPLSINYFRQRRAGFTLISKACERGFTLIELLVVIVIIGILMGILLVSYQGTRKTARDGKRKADLEQIRSALQMYHADCGKYPNAITWPGAGALTGGEAACSGITYMSKLPEDPLASLYKYVYVDEDDHHYDLYAYLEGGGTVTPGNCSVADSISCNYQVNEP